MKKTKKIKDTIVMFRWDFEKELALRKISEMAGITLSCYIRKILDKFLITRGIKWEQKDQSLPSVSTPHNSLK